MTNRLRQTKENEWRKHGKRIAVLFNMIKSVVFYVNDMKKERRATRGVNHIFVWCLLHVNVYNNRMCGKCVNPNVSKLTPADALMNISIIIFRRAIWYSDNGMQRHTWPRCYVLCAHCAHNLWYGPRYLPLRYSIKLSVWTEICVQNVGVHAMWMRTTGFSKTHSPLYPLANIHRDRAHMKFYIFITSKSAPTHRILKFLSLSTYK